MGKECMAVAVPTVGDRILEGVPPNDRGLSLLLLSTAVIQVKKVSVIGHRVGHQAITLVGHSQAVSQGNRLRKRRGADCNLEASIHRSIKDRQIIDGHSLASNQQDPSYQCLGSLVCDIRARSSATGRSQN